MAARGRAASAASQRPDHRLFAAFVSGLPAGTAGGAAELHLCRKEGLFAFGRVGEPLVEEPLGNMGVSSQDSI